MAQYSGNVEIFSKMIGPRLRNIVQQKIARQYKKDIGKCEDCGRIHSKDNILEAAHKHGKERPTLLKNAYIPYLENGLLHNLDLEEFEKKFIELHNPLADTFRILCKECHISYDLIIKENQTIDISPTLESSVKSNSDVLTIELYPEDKDEFTELFLLHRSATIEIIYTDNTKTVPPIKWNAQKFSESSDVLHNLRSRVKFRQENWKKNNNWHSEKAGVDRGSYECF